VKRHLVASPAPGLLLVGEDRIWRAEDKVVHVETRTLLLADDALLEIVGQGSVTKRPQGDLGELRRVAEFKDTRAAALARTLDAREPPAAGATLFRGTVAGSPILAGLSVDEELPLVWQLEVTREAPQPPKKEASWLCAAVREKPGDFGEAAADLARGCDKLEKGEAQVQALTTQLAESTTAGALADWRKARDASAVLVAAQRNALESAFQKRKDEVAVLETTALTERLGAVADAAGLKTWTAERDAALPILFSEQRTRLDRGLREKKTALGKAEKDALAARVAGAASAEALDALKAELTAATLLDYGQRSDLERAMRTRRSELAKNAEAKQVPGGKP
jgi:hypothetical protein